MKRRQALLGLGGLAAVAALAPLVPLESGVTAILLKRLRYLDLDPGGVRQFAREYAYRHLMSNGKLRAVSAVAPLYRRLPQAWSDRVTPDVAHGEERVVTTFLLSSDFFAGGADAGRPVRYLGFFDPLRGGNPFARLRVQTGEGSGFVQATSCEEPCLTDRR